MRWAYFGERSIRMHGVVIDEGGRVIETLRTQRLDD